MPRTIRTLAAALAALVIAAPAAFAMPIDGPADASSSSGVTAVPEQDLRSPDARDAALHRHKPATAPAAERYYSSHGPAQTITPTSVPVANTRDGIDPLRSSSDSPPP
jgi:hypothetical protein